MDGRGSVGTLKVDDSRDVGGGENDTDLAAISAACLSWHPLFFLLFPLADLAVFFRFAAFFLGATSRLGLFDAEPPPAFLRSYLSRLVS